MHRRPPGPAPFPYTTLFRSVEKMAPLDDKESLQVLSTLIKQRKESADQFRKGGRDQMADKEEAEITLIESYMPKAAGRSEEHTSELQSHVNLVCRLLLEKKN